MKKHSLHEIVQLNEDAHSVLTALINSPEYKDMISKINDTLEGIPDEDYTVIRSAILPRIIDNFKHSIK